MAFDWKTCQHIMFECRKTVRVKFSVNDIEREKKSRKLKTGQFSRSAAAATEDCDSSRFQLTFLAVVLIYCRIINAKLNKKAIEINICVFFFCL